jgi:hypothetical protein
MREGLVLIVLSDPPQDETKGFGPSKEEAARSGWSNIEYRCENLRSYFCTLMRDRYANP